MNIAEVVKGIFTFLFEDATNSILTPILDFVTLIALSPETLAKMAFIDPLFSITQKIGAAILILVVSWQGLKSMGLGMGLEADEPQKIAVKALIAGFLIYGIKDLLIKMIEICSGFINLIMDSANIAIEGTGLTEYISKFMTGGNGILYTIIGLFLLFKMIGLMYRMFKRLAMCALLIICSPLAVAAMVSKPTEGFWQGFVKLFVGNIIIQIVQALCIVACIASLQMGVATGGNVTGGEDVFSIMLTIVLISITSQLEDIIRDLSISVGINRDMQGAMGKLQGMAYTATSISSVSRFIHV